MHFNLGKVQKYIERLSYKEDPGDLKLGDQTYRESRVFVQLKDKKTLLSKNRIKDAELATAYKTVDGNKLHVWQYSNGFMDFGEESAEATKSGGMWSSGSAQVFKISGIECYEYLRLEGGGRLLKVLAEDLVALLDYQHSLIRVGNSLRVVKSKDIDCAYKLTEALSSRSINIKKVLFRQPIIQATSGRIEDYKVWIDDISKENRYWLYKYENKLKYFHYNYYAKSNVAIKQMQKVFVGAMTNRGFLNRKQLENAIEQGYILNINGKVLQLYDMLELDIPQDNICEVDKSRKMDYEAEAIMGFEEDGKFYSPSIVVTDYMNIIKPEYKELKF